MGTQPISVLSRRLWGALRSVRALSSAPAARPILLAAGLAVFAVLAVRAFRSIPPVEHPSWIAVSLLVVVTTPVTLALNAAEFRLIGATVGTSFGWRSAFSTTLLASLANLLPLPGSAVVRTTALVRAGASLRGAGESNALAAMIWAASATLVAGVGLSGTGGPGPVVLAILIGAVVALVLAGLRVVRLAGAMVALRLVAIEVVTVAVSGLRIFLGFAVLRQSPGIAESVVISSGQVIAALIGFAPGGLGLRELFAGVLAASIGSDSDVAIAATVIDRAAAQVGMLLALLVLVVAPGGTGGKLLAQLKGTATADAATPDPDRNDHV